MFDRLFEFIVLRIYKKLLNVVAKVKSLRKRQDFPESTQCGEDNLRNDQFFSAFKRSQPYHFYGNSIITL